MVFSDVVKNGWILPHKEKYTMRDFNKLHGAHDALTSRFIIVCSAAHYWSEGKKTGYSKMFDKIEKFIYMSD